MDSISGKRTLRSTVKSSSITSTQIEDTTASTYPPSPYALTPLPPNTTSTQTLTIYLFPNTSSTTKLPHLSKPELALLRKKQSKLRATSPATLNSLNDISPYSNPNLSNSTSTSPLLSSLLSTLLFAGEEAGTAVVIHQDGWVLTCAHCFAESASEWESISSSPSKSKSGKEKWLLFYEGTAVLMSCEVWDGKRDLALCRISGIEMPPQSHSQPPPLAQHPERDIQISFTSLPISPTSPNNRTPIYCLGQPGAEDLESPTPGVKTKYNLLEISKGRFNGLIKGQDPQDNEEIGALMHDAWTYWGHSGAPLVVLSKREESKGEKGGDHGSGKEKGEKEGKLVGLHSSWDDQTGMRHGVPGEAIIAFLEECSARLGININSY